ncbi:hypothetical protein LOZ12_005180 [Ophidiomyces ophidiicola]|uniref:Uncharacterized protein n=1 Tax=Ophidiomyces ophidiicola TaxID=1387563 RepID=A0ACB8UXQ8_9EURO|nr:hypothetical protein LOZ64_001448 [Ophidiomyces ophidiicola]KAI1946288.1 hypothetical protein LOZ62_003398 [Ophidiomyces ophidiicola]KAI1951404.1 hypothetical protein LOZ59_005660 [Ophidiomyces ophidiicola]KAI1971393.1 hypothetical protein LOZ56_003093 [Ophidiomyces ophidiicola]KAI2001756.1 hypothetical protein LOZ50_005456 [Ophidiomyces ophidiicola]
MSTSVTKTQITPDFYITEAGTSENGEPIILYFVPGNPGLVSYYHSFLSLLASNLSSSPHVCPDQTGASDCSSSSVNTAQGSNNSASNVGDSGTIVERKGASGNTRSEQPSDETKDAGMRDPDDAYLIAGRSLAGFEIEDATVQSSSNDSEASTDAVYGLSAQVEHVESNLAKIVRKYLHNHITTTSATNAAGAEKDAASSRRRPRPKVILMGHSVGSYLCMEVIRRWKEREEERVKAAGKETGAASGDSHEVEMDIIGALLMFPTVVDIAKSPSGRKLTTLANIPYLDHIASHIVNGLLFIMPSPVLRWVVQYVMGSAPKDAVDTTLAFLKSRTGVRQALHMGAEEMEQIGSDKWSDEIWGVAGDVKSQLTKLVFYFGRNDHWVAEQTRDEIIRARASKGDHGPKMIVCDDGIKHGFCISEYFESVFLSSYSLS